MKKTIKLVKTIKGKFKDESGYLSRYIELKRLAKYANEIDTVLTKYNKKSCEETMMVKGLRKSCGETTNRKIHQEDLEKIVKQIAKGIGLNEEIVAIMGKHHDIGHTFLGHSGEWWLSSIQEDYGIGYTGHNTLGERELVYTNKVYDEIIEKIKVHNPKISQKQLDKIKNSLWLIMDGINTHNGETISREYIPDVQKTKDQATREMIDCYTIEGYDRQVTPSTIEACLMRLADQISYIPLDMVDGLREGLVRVKEGKEEKIVNNLDNEYIAKLTQLGITKEEIEEGMRTEIYTKIAERLKEILINDVIQNSTKKKITMSQEMMKLMNELKLLNNKKAVNNVVLVEDQKTYPQAIRILMNRYKEIILQNGLLGKIGNKNIDTSDVLQQYNGTPDEQFAKYACSMNIEDFNLTIQIAKEATEKSIEAEQEIARRCVLEGTKYEEKAELGLDYTLKNNRVKKYIEYYQTQLQDGKLVGYNEERKQDDIDKIMNNIEQGKINSNYVSKEERIALLIAKDYIATLNDKEFIQLLENTEMISKEQKESLTRKYKDIPNLLDEVYETSRWKEINSRQMQEGVMLADAR